MRIWKPIKVVRIVILMAAFGAGLAGAAETPSVPKAEPSFTHVDAKKAQQLITDKKVSVLDLRTPQEFKAGHIAGATNIDFLASDFEDRIRNLEKNKAYLVHCAAGTRSTHSLATFKRQQFSSIYHLD